MKYVWAVLKALAMSITGGVTLTLTYWITGVVINPYLIGVLLGSVFTTFGITLMIYLGVFKEGD